jgi:hypothetical protein
MALPALLLLSAAAPAPKRPARQAVSMAESWNEKDGRRITHTVNRRFSYATAYPERTRGESLVLSETFDRLFDSGAEGEKSMVTVEAFRADDALGAHPRWSLRAEGSGGEPAENLYRVSRPGCCGAQDLSLYFSLLNGRPLFSADSPILSIEAPNTSFKRFVAYHGPMAATPHPKAAAEKNAVGVLQYGSDRAPASAVLVVAAATDEIESYSAKKISLILDGKEVEGDRLDVWAADKAKDPAKISGFAIRVRDYKEPDFLFEIPVEADHLAFEKAKTAPGIRLVRVK